MPPFATLFSTPRLLILETFSILRFYSRLPVYQFMCTVDSGSVKPRERHKTVWCTCFFITMTFISIYSLRFRSDSSFRKTLYFLYFLLIFSQDRLMILFQWNFWLMYFCHSPRLFQPLRLLTLEIFANFPIYCTLPFCYFGRNLPASLFIPPSPSIWNSRVHALPMHRGSYYDIVLAIETKIKIPSLSSTMMLI